MLSDQRQLDLTTAVGKWLRNATPALGNTVTEVTQTAPNELTVVRNSTGGLTAFELFAFAHWLQATNFPGFDLYFLPPP